MPKYIIIILSSVPTACCCFNPRYHFCVTGNPGQWWRCWRAGDAAPAAERLRLGVMLAKLCSKAIQILTCMKADFSL